MLGVSGGCWGLLGAARAAGDCWELLGLLGTAVGQGLLETGGYCC